MFFEHSLWGSGHRPEFVIEKDLREGTWFDCCPVRLTGNGAMQVAISNLHVRISEQQIDTPAEHIVIEASQL